MQYLLKLSFRIKCYIYFCASDRTFISYFRLITPNRRRGTEYTRHSLSTLFLKIKSFDVNKSLRDAKGSKSHFLHCFDFQREISLPFSRDDHLSRLVPVVLNSLRKPADRFPVGKVTSYTIVEVVYFLRNISPRYIIITIYYLEKQKSFNHSQQLRPLFKLKFFHLN